MRYDGYCSVVGALSKLKLLFRTWGSPWRLENNNVLQASKSHGMGWGSLIAGRFMYLASVEQSISWALMGFFVPDRYQYRDSLVAGRTEDPHGFS